MVYSTLIRASCMGTLSDCSSFNPSVKPTNFLSLLATRPDACSKVNALPSASRIASPIADLNREILSETLYQKNVLGDTVQRTIRRDNSDVVYVQGTDAKGKNYIEPVHLNPLHFIVAGLDLNTGEGEAIPQIADVCIP